MPVAMLMLLAAPPEVPLTTYRERTRAEIACQRTIESSEITVCGRRAADRYRISFVEVDPRDSVPTQRSQLLEPKMGGCGRVGPFFTDCGAVGISMTSGAGHTSIKPRQLAP